MKRLIAALFICIFICTTAFSYERIKKTSSCIIWHHSHTSQDYMIVQNSKGNVVVIKLDKNNTVKNRRTK